MMILSLLGSENPSFRSLSFYFNNGGLEIIVSVIFAICFIIILCLIYFCSKKKVVTQDNSKDLEKFEQKQEQSVAVVVIDELEKEDLVSFQGCDDLTIQDILDAPGEVIGKSSYGTLYKACFERTNTIALLRFLRPACTTGSSKDIMIVIQMLGYIRHSNLVPLQAFYTGARGEKLLVYPYFNRGNLAQFLREGNRSLRKWDVIFRISVGIARAMEYLHTGLQKTIIHGNLKSRNILLDGNYQPYVSDFGLHLLLNPTTGQELLEASASQGYKAPELIKMRDASKESDIYNLGVILLELITGKAPVNKKTSPSHDLYLSDSVREAIIGHRITDLFHPDVLLEQSTHRNPVTEERLLKFGQLAMACCSPSPPLRPHVKQVVKKLEEIGQ